MERLAGDRARGEEGRRRVAELCAPEKVADELSSIYGQALARRGDAS
jgi:hypothetical protein